MTSNLLHERHEKHVMVDSKVGFLEYRSKLKLVRRNLVVASLARNTKFESMNFKILHESLHALWDSTKVVVVHLLVLSRVVSHKCAACKHKVGTCRI